MPKTNDPIMCPMKASTFIVRRVHAIPGSTQDTTVDMFVDQTSFKLLRFTAASLLLLFRATTMAMGYSTLGFHASEIGTHSNRSVSAMSIYLNVYPYIPSCLWAIGAPIILTLHSETSAGVYQQRLN